MKFAAAHPSDLPGAEALLALAVVDYENTNYDRAVSTIRPVEKRLKQISDYVSYLVAASQFGSQNYANVPLELTTLWRSQPKSPLFAKSVLMAAKAGIEMNQPKDSIELVRRYLKDLPQPEATMLLAQAAEKLPDPMAAASYYQSVYYGYPQSGEASDASERIAALRTALGDRFPPSMPPLMLKRAMALLTKDPAQAKKELEQVADQIGGADRDLARVRIGVADYNARANQAAASYLQALRVSTPEADAERLHYLNSALRRLNRDDEARAVLNELSLKYPTSPWRLESLVNTANAYLVKAQPDQYLPLYRACADAFADSSQAPACHWKLAWNAYITRQSNAAEMLKQHIGRYPTSEKAAAALYFLGRLAERNGQFSDARAYYQAIEDRFPNFFHAVLARAKLKESNIAKAAPAPEVQAFVNIVPLPSHAPSPNFQTTPATNAHIERAHILAAAGLDDWADTELRFAARTDAQPNVIAMELAQLAQQRGAYDQGIRAIKSIASGYLSLPFEAAPVKFWQLAFPMPYKQALETYSKERALDPFLVAALIRQESEFNPQAVSRAKAYGLTQVLPRTGRELARKIGMAGFSAQRLFEPEFNMRLGTYYLKSLLNDWNGRIEATLASYNAGKSRVASWLNLAQYEEPAEFIESIPFTETRNYVQIVLRNADIYRRLYGK